MLHLLELERVDGYGEHSSYDYYLCDCRVPIKKGTDNLTDSAIKSLNSRYPDMIFKNCGYHHWTRIASGSYAEYLYHTYLGVEVDMRILKAAGVRV